MHVPTFSPLAAGGVNPDSTVSAETVAVAHAPGAYPHFTQVPAIPTDVRPVAAWRTAVVGEWHVKTRTERDAAAIPFTLTETEDWAQRTRKKIPVGQTTPPALDAAQQIEAFAAAERARATPPPPPQ
ncbi:MAG TPA: hypothetical protein VHY32_05005 [Caulobacteraceae bacterium]|jgi:hypothetical protein|nr:hypothetical protein [Caulobacteraceae bacterium]